MVLLPFFLLVLMRVRWAARSFAVRVSAELPSALGGCCGPRPSAAAAAAAFAPGGAGSV
jgi:hypothetical protein